MADTKPQGCLAVILGLFGIRLAGPVESTPQLPYQKRDDFLSAAELSFYRVLLTGLDGSFTVCPKVNLSDVIFVVGRHGSQSYRNKIDRKHVDFLLCAPTTMMPIIGVELDDASHSRPDRQDRDRFVDQVFEAAGLPLLHVRAASGYNPQQLSQLVHDAVAGHPVHEKVIAQQDGTPVCPKCGIEMVQRTATKGGQQGKKFWGCSNYPKCREVLQME